MSSLDAMPSFLANTSDGSVKEWISQVAPNARSPEEMTEVSTMIAVDSSAQVMDKHSFGPSFVLAIPHRPFSQLHPIQIDPS